LGKKLILPVKLYVWMRPKVLRLAEKLDDYKPGTKKRLVELTNEKDRVFRSRGYDI